MCPFYFKILIIDLYLSLSTSEDQEDMPLPIKDLMDQAYALACQAAQQDEVPIGSLVISPTGIVIADGYNLTETTKDPSAHAEVVAIRRACQALNQKRLDGCHLITTLEPCPMCADLIAKSRIHTLYIGAKDPKGGGLLQGPQVYTHATCFHKPHVNWDFQNPVCGTILSTFFKKKRAQPRF